MRLILKYLKISVLIVGAFGCGSRNSSSKESKTPQKKQEPLSSVRVFDYKPEKPQDGRLYAAIELGSLGLNYFIVEMDSKNRWNLVNSYYGRSNIIYGANNTKELVSEINRYIKDIQSQGINKADIHIIASSSVVRLENIALINSELTKTGFKVKSITTDQEAKYALMATIPKEFADESFLVDIGSGNSKLSWTEGNDTLSIEIHGSKYFLSGVQDTTVFREVRDALLEIPEKNRNLCFMLGGMIFEFLKEEVDSNDNRYFVLKPPGVYPTDNEKLKAGNVIYSALYLEPTYSYIFDSQSNFTIGYLASMNSK